MADRAQPHPVDIAVGLAIRARRRAVGVSQESLAEAIGVTFQQVQKYENGSNRVSCSRLVLIAQALSCSAAELLPDNAGEATSARTSETAFFSQPGAHLLARQYAALDAPRQRSVRTIMQVLAETMDDGDQPSAAYVTGGDTEGARHVPA